ncbi:helix-turn-helix transcriptional regulator [Nonomuraea sp. PA05]|nr:helix-turn-helix transcriptional regulator [Nonomuraea sp. PA05]
MVRVRSHLRRLRSGKVIHVRSHSRRTSSPSGSSGTATSGLLWGGLAMMVFLGVLFGVFLATTGNPTPVASETEKTARPQPTAPATLPPGPEGEFAGRLREARMNTGLSRSEISALTGIAESTIDDFERALAVPSAETLKALSSAYRLSFDDWTALEITRSELR